MWEVHGAKMPSLKLTRLKKEILKEVPGAG